ncbi:MAG: pitrilysin family protein, partial [Bacteroidota bacterium]
MTLRHSRTALFSLALMAGFALAPQPQTFSLAVATTQANEEKSGPEVTSFFLDNGMQVVVIPDRRAPVVTHMVWYRAGSADEPPGKSGIAHYLEHLMFKGTKNTANGEFSKRVSEIGGQDNAFTSTDYTGYFQRVTPSALGEMMALEADRMENLVLTDELIIPEREVVQEERNSRIENNPGSMFGEAMRATLYQNHPYGTPVIGWEHEVNALTKDDAIAFYNKYYTPNNAILVVAGDVDAVGNPAIAADANGVRRATRVRQSPTETVGLLGVVAEALRSGRRDPRPGAWDERVVAAVVVERPRRVLQIERRVLVETF